MAEQAKSGLTSYDCQFRVHTPQLLDEIASCSNQPILKIPLNMLRMLLAQVGKRAAELNDPKLNALMCQLTIYSVADPYNKDYCPDTVREVMRALD